MGWLFRHLTAWVLTLAVMGFVAPAQAQEPISFGKTFTPDTIGPGGVSTLLFTISNVSGTPLTDVDFTDVLPTVPGAITIADGAASSTCAGATLTAPIGGGTISFDDGLLGIGETCTVTVNVTGSTPGVHTNTTGAITSSAGPSLAATDDLTVVTTLPGFSKSVSPNPASFGDIVTVTYLIDNSANASNVLNLDFSETFPADISIASPANATTDCGTAVLPPVLTAPAGGSVISLDADGTFVFPAVALGVTCTVSVDIVAGTTGSIPLVSGDLLANFTSAGSSSDTLEVTAASTTEPTISKVFSGDPVGPGGSATLEFTIINADPVNDMTDVKFTDDLSAMFSGSTLLGATGSGFPTNPCGPGSVISGSGTISLSSGFLPARSSCTFSITVDIPLSATAGTYTNISGPVTADIDGEDDVGEDSASDTLEVPAGSPLTLTKLYVGDPVDAGDDVTLRFTIGNPNTTLSPQLGATDITFIDELTFGGPGTGFLPFPVSVTLPPVPDPPCGALSSLSLVSIPGFGDRQALSLTGGSLGPAETSCTFEVVVTIPPDLPGGTYTNTTGDLTATISGQTLTTAGASDDVSISAGVNLSFTKAFSATAAPGGTVDLTFTIANDPESVLVTDIDFDDDLTFLAGLTAGAPTVNTCGGTMGGTPTDLDYTGGLLAAGASCTITVPVTVPATAATGTYTNTTSDLTVTGAGATRTFAPAEADLSVAGISFTKEFIGDPVIAGDTLPLRFTIENQHPTDDATITFFTDSLSTTLAGLAATGGATTDTCGGSLSGTTFLIYVGGSVTAGSSCEIEVPVLVPPASADGTYTNTTSSLSTSFGTIAPAVDDLTVMSAQLSLSKAFTDDPVAPGDTVTLEFTVENQNTAAAASGVAFNDDLSAMLAGTTFNSILFNDCGGTIGGTGTSLIDVSGVSLTSGATCTLRVSSTVDSGATAGGYVNTTSGVTGTISGFPVTGDPATDTLDVTTVGTSFSKSFSYPATPGGAAIPGGTATLSFTITNPNAGTITALGFTDDLNAVIPGLVATSLPANPCGPSSTISGTSTLAFTGGELAPLGGTCSFDVEVTLPTSASGGTFPNTTSDLTSAGLFSASPATADLTVVDAADVSVTKTDGVTAATAGGSLTYTIVAANAGPSTDPSVSLTDTFPADLTCTYTSVAAGGATGNTAAGAGDLSETLSMPASSNVTYTVSCDIASSATGTLSNTAVVAASVFDPNTANDSATDDDTVLSSEADLSITKTDGVTSATPGGQVVYTIVAANAGPSDDPSVTVSDTFPGVLNCSHSASLAGGASGSPSSSGDLSDTFSMPAGASVTYTSTCDIDTATTGTLSNTATIAGTVTDPSPGNNSATDADTVLAPEADISVTKDDGLTSVDAGGSLTYTIDVANAGPSDDPSVAFADTFPANLSCTYTSSASGGATGNSSSASPAASISDTLNLPAGSSVSYSAVCTVDVAATGTLSNTATATASVTDPAPGNNSATDADTVIDPATIVFSKAFSPDSIQQGAESVLTFTIDNTGNVVSATGMTFDDPFPTGVVVADTPAVTNGCGGTFTASPGATSADLSGGTVAANSSCTISVTVRADLPGSLDNVTSDLTSSLPTVGGATDTLDVAAAEPPLFTKLFSPDTIDQGAETLLTFTIDNTANAIEANTLAFDDTLPTGVVVADVPAVTNGCGGTFTAPAGAAAVDLAGGVIAAGATCTIEVMVRADVPGTLDNITSDLTSSIATAEPATDTLAVNAADAPDFTKVFDPDIIDQGAETRLTFTIDNTANSIEANTLVFDDTLPTGVVVADVPDVTNGCGGTFTATAGATSVDLSAGVVAAGTTCTIEVMVRADEAGVLDNVTSTLTSSIATATAAMDTLTVNAAAPPTFTKVFSPDVIDQGAETTLIFTIDNIVNSIEANTLVFSDPLPSGVMVADVPSVSNDCGGTFTATAGATSVDLAGGVVAAGATCTIEVAVRAEEAGSRDNVTTTLTSSIATAAAATDTLTINAAQAPVFTKEFTPDTIDQGGETVLTFTIDNSANSIEANTLVFEDVFPTGLSVADDPNVSNDCGGSFTADAGTETVGLDGGLVAAGAVCTIDVSVRAIIDGSLDNVTSDLTSSIATAEPATDTLTVNRASPPVFTKTFTPDVIDQGLETVLTFTIDNSANLIDATSLAFTDPLNSGVFIAASPSAASTCGGTVNTSNPSEIVFSGGTVEAGSICEISVTLRAFDFGTFDNVTSDLTSSLDPGEPATATLTINEVPLLLTKNFGPDTIEEGGISTLTFGFRNVATIGAADITLIDALPAGVTIASPVATLNTCPAGIIDAPAGGTTISFSGGTLGVGQGCTVSVDVTSSVAGVYPNTTDTVTSSLGTSVNASATLTVEASVGSATLIINQESDTDGLYEFSSTEPAFNFLMEVNGGTGTSGALTAAPGSYTITQSAPEGVGNTSITCDDGNSTGDAPGRTISAVLEDGETVTCTIVSINSLQKTVDTINRFLTRRADLILSSEPRPGRRFDRLNRGFGNASRFSWSPGDLKSFLPFTAEISRGSNEYRFSTSLVQMREAGASLQLAHGAKPEAVYVDNYRFDAWFEAQYKEFDGSESEGHFAIAYFGADYLLTPDILVGALLQIDDMDDFSSTNNSSASGTGWMVGPYVTARLAPNLVFDGRIAAGKSTNEVSPFNTYTDDFNTDRWMAMASLTGQFQSGPWTIRPTASLSYFQETQDSYIDSVGVFIPSQTVELGQLKLGPTFSGEFVTPGGTVYAPYFSIDAIYNLGGTSGVTITNPTTPEVEGWRARVQAGVDFTTEGGTRISFGGSYDGIGQSDLDVWGLMFDVTIPLKKAKAR